MPAATTPSPNLAATKLAWIKARIAEGRTVYLSTTLRHTKISAKHMDLLRVRGESLEVLTGKQGWLNHNHSRLSAQ